MGYTAKNINTGANKDGIITVSFGGTDLGAIKEDSLKLKIGKKIIRLGDSESFNGAIHAMRGVEKVTLSGVLQENTLANIKLVADLTDSPTPSTNPALMNINYDFKDCVTGALVITTAAPRTTALAAQTRTITFAKAFSSIEQIETGITKSKIAEIPFEFEALLSTSQEVLFSDENA